MELWSDILVFSFPRARWMCSLPLVCRSWSSILLREDHVWQSIFGPQFSRRALSHWLGEQAWCWDRIPLSSLNGSDVLDIESIPVVKPENPKISASFQVTILGQDTDPLYLRHAVIWVDSNPWVISFFHLWRLVDHSPLDKEEFQVSCLKLPDRIQICLSRCQSGVVSKSVCLTTEPHNWLRCTLSCPGVCDDSFPKEVERNDENPCSVDLDLTVAFPVMGGQVPSYVFPSFDRTINFMTPPNILDRGPLFSADLHCTSGLTGTRCNQRVSSSSKVTHDWNSLLSTYQTSRQRCLDFFVLTEPWHDVFPLCMVSSAYWYEGVGEVMSCYFVLIDLWQQQSSSSFEKVRQLRYCCGHRLPSFIYPIWYNSTCLVIQIGNLGGVFHQFVLRLTESHGWSLHNDPSLAERDRDLDPIQQCCLAAEAFAKIKDSGRKTWNNPAFLDAFAYD